MDKIGIKRKEITSPMKAIRSHCKQCVGTFEEIKVCGGEKTCPLFAFRMGKNPYRKIRILTEDQKQAASERFKKYREGVQ